MFTYDRCFRRSYRARYKDCREAHEAGKGIIVINKWDAVKKENGTFENYKKKYIIN